MSITRMSSSLISTVKLGFALKTVYSERLRRISEEGFWIVIGHVLAVLGSLVGVRMLTELLDPGAYGELALGMTVATLVNQAVLGPLSNGATRFYAPAQEKQDVDGYLRAVRKLTFLATGIIVLVMVLMAMSLVLIGWVNFIGIMCAALIFAILSGYTTIFNGIQNAARHRRTVAMHQGLEPWARYLAAVASMVWLGASSTTAMIGCGVGVSLVIASQYVFFRVPVHEPGPVDHSRKWQQEIWKYSQPITVFGMFTWVQMASDRWALELFTSTQEVGLYAVLFQLGYYPISIATGMAVQFIAPIFYQRAGDATDSRRKTEVNNLSWYLTKIALGVTGVLFLFSFFCHPQIFQAFVATEYGTVSYLLPWMLLGGGIFAAGQTIALNLMSQMKTQTMAKAKIVSALMGGALNFAGAYWLGMTGIIIASVIFSVVYFVWMALLSKYEENEECR